MKRAYVPSGKSEPGALAKLGLLAVLVASVAGIAEGVVSYLWLSLLIVFPVVIGFAAGGTATALVEKGKVRAPATAAALAALAALVGQGLTHFAEYQMWRRAMVEKLSESPIVLGADSQPGAEGDEGEPAGSEGEEAAAAGVTLDGDAAVDLALMAETGQSGFLGYLKMAAAGGVTLSRATSSSDSGLTIDGTGTSVMWGVEFLIAAGVAFSMAWGRARAPFCELCKSWYSRTDVLAVGSTLKTTVREVVKALDQGELQKAMEPELLGQGLDNASALLVMDRCATCQESEPLLSYKVVVQTSKGKAQATEKWKSLVRSDEAKLLDDLAQKRAAAEAAHAPASEPAT